MSKLPPEALEQRPHLMTDDEAEHPVNGPMLGPVPRQYTRGLHDAIVQKIRQGNRPVAAAQQCGITAATFSRWMQLGKDGNPHLWQFAEDVECATAVPEGAAIASITGPEGKFDDPDNAKWWLERARPEGYSKEANAKVHGMIAEFLERLSANLPPEIFKMVVAAAAGHSPRLAAQYTPPELTSGSDEEEDK